MIWNIRKKNTTNQNKEKKESKNEDSVSSLWDNFKQLNIRFIGMPEGEEKEKEIGNLFEKIMRETIPKLMKDLHVWDMHVQEAQSPKQDKHKEAHSKTHHN